MTLDLLLKNGQVIIHGKETTRSVGIKGNKIGGVYEVGQEPVAKEKIDCTGMYILPGIIDIHVHMRDLKQKKKEDYRTGTKAAAVGGVTTVVDMPNTEPPVLDYATLVEKINCAKEKRFVNVGFYSGIPKEIAKVDAHLVRDVLGFKVYPHAPLDKRVRYTKSRIKQCMKFAMKKQRPLLMHPDLIKENTIENSLIAFFNKHDCKAEFEAVQHFLDVWKIIGGHLHICHVSCAETARLISDNKGKLKQKLTAEVTPHHLFLTREDFSFNNGYAKTLPPLRERSDNQDLLKFLCKGVIDCVASDHAPHSENEKAASFLKAPAGIPGLETILSLMVTGVLEGKLSWSDYLRACCRAPAKIVGLERKGVIGKGFDADLVIVGRENYRIRGRDFVSKARVTPFEGQLVKAKVVLTIVEGTVVYRFGKFVVDSGVAGKVPVRKC